MAITINGTANTVAGVAAGGINDNVVDNGTMADDAIGIAELSATGTASSSTFLRGDNAWAAAGGGKVVKHAFQSYDTQGNTTSSSFQDTGLSISYTPVAANNLIYCIAMQQCYIWNNGGGDGRAQYNLLQGSTQIALSQFECSGTNSLESVGNEILMGRFTAANTSAVTVKTQYRRVAAGGQAAAYAQHGGRASTLTIIEVEP